MSRKILIDMDDVICDFIGGVFEVVGIEEEDFLRRVPALDTSWKITSLCGIPEDIVWNMIDRRGYSFWGNLKPLPWGMKLWKELYQQYGENLYVCTSPQPTLACYSAKVEWIWYYLQTMNIILCPDKTLLKPQEALMIDDNPAVISHFGENGFLFPGINNSKRNEWLEFRRNPSKALDIVREWIKERSRV